MKLSRASVGLAVRAVREAARLTLDDLSHRTGISVPSLSRSENGLRDTDFSEMVSIAAAVGLELETLRTLAETFEYAGVASTAKKKADLKDELFQLQRAAIEAAIEASNS